MRHEDMGVRHEGLGKRFAPLAKAVAVAIALETGAGMVGDKAVAQEARVERREQKIPASIREQISKFEKQKISLDETEIHDQLKRNNLEAGTRIFDIAVPEGERIYIDEYTWFGKRLKKIAKSGSVSGLNVVRIDFARAAEDLGMMSYWMDYRALFVNRPSDFDQRRDMMESYLALSLTRLLRNADIASLWRQRAKLGENLFHEKTRARGSFYDTLERGQPRLDSFTPQSIKKYEPQLLSDAKTYRLNWARRYVHDTFALPHEIFHHKFETQLFQPGYRGPDADELIFAALKSKRERFPDSDGVYQFSTFASDILKIGGYNINVSDDVLRAVSSSLARYFDITERGENPEDSEVGMVRPSPQQTLRYTLRSYVNEYLARIYAGALGATPITVMRSLSKVGRMHGQVSRYHVAIRNNFHEPTEEELFLLQRMEYKGKPILPERNSTPSLRPSTPQS